MKKLIGLVLLASMVMGPQTARLVQAKPVGDRARIRSAVQRGLKYLAAQQSRQGKWEANNGTYPVAMTALCGMAFLLDGNTTTQGPYAANVARAVEFLVSQGQPNGLIGDPRGNQRYTYGHGFSMMFLSQVLGEEEDGTRRKKLVRVLKKAVEFSAKAQTTAGGWGYVSAKDGRDFDEGSTCVTQMQGLRACRNAGIHVPKEVIDRGVKYIEGCTNSDGGIQYSAKSRGASRPPISAAAVACMFNAGEYKNAGVQKMIKYVDGALPVTTSQNSHWHYAHYYLAQVNYRRGDKVWAPYKKKVTDVLFKNQGPDGGWHGGYVGSVYTTALSLTMLQIDNDFLPLYQR